MRGSAGSERRIKLYFPVLASVITKLWKDTLTETVSSKVVIVGQVLRELGVVSRSHAMPISASCSLVWRSQLMQKISRMPRPARTSDELFDPWVHAVALAMLRRQMHSRWTSRSRSSRLVLA